MNPTSQATETTSPPLPPPFDALARLPLVEFDAGGNLALTRAEMEQQRADAAEADLARLRTCLVQLAAPRPEQPASSTP